LRTRNSRLTDVALQADRAVQSCGSGRAFRSGRTGRSGNSRLADVAFDADDALRPWRSGRALNPLRAFMTDDSTFPSVAFHSLGSDCASSAVTHARHARCDHVGHLTTQFDELPLQFCNRLIRFGLEHAKLPRPLLLRLRERDGQRLTPDIERRMLGLLLVSVLH
jgi:hypothetical protein